MCGFAGMVGFDGLPADKQAVDRMTVSLLHRGPDDGDIYIKGGVGLGVRRLAILDLSSAAHQPMISEDGELVLVFNGEIFNYIELRQELQSLGHAFRSTGDTEVLLHAYQQWGHGCLQKLNGMWAFLIYDRQRGCVFGSRDRFGVKPFFYHRTSRYALFASEIKAIRASGLYRGGQNWRVIAQFLLQGRLDVSDEREETFYSEIARVPAGTAFEIDLYGHWKQWRYWSLSTIPSTDLKDPVESFVELFEDSVRLRMRSDVPVGVTLSGGLDSTSIICTLANLKSKPESEKAASLQAFCFMAEEYDESSYIAETLTQTRALLNRLKGSPLGLWEKLPRVLWFQDEPVNELNAVVGSELMKMAATNGVRVVLTGEGADETIGGYSSYFSDYWQMLIRQGRIRAAWNEIQRYASVHKSAHGRAPWNCFLSAFGTVGLTALHHISAYRSFSSWRNQRKYRNNGWFVPELSRYLDGEERQGPTLSLNDVLKNSVERAPLPLYLRIEDRNSMAHSVESRVPFMDYRLVSLLYNIPSEWKLRGPWNKFVLREAMRHRIPESVRTRPDKMGFPVPTAKWFANELYSPLREVLASQDARSRGIYNMNEILRDLERHRKGEGKGDVNVAARLLYVAQFEILNKVVKDSPLTASVDQTSRVANSHLTSDRS